jgi:hypothetical protein
VCIISTTNNPVIILNVGVGASSLQLGAGNSLDLNGGSIGVNGSDIINAGQIDIEGIDGKVSFTTGVATTLSGQGTVTLSSTNTPNGLGSYAMLFVDNGSILTNANNTIQGDGAILTYGGKFVNEGTIDANATSSAAVKTLSIVTWPLSGYNGTFANSGLMKATGSGILQIDGTIVNNAGGNITANGGTVQLYGGTIIEGGTLSTLNGGTMGTPTLAGGGAALDGSTSAGAVTLNGTYTSGIGTDTYLFGSIINNGNILVNGGGSGATHLFVPGSVTLSGGGTVTLNTTAAGAAAAISLHNGATLTNVNNTIQGEGEFSTGYYSGAGTTLINEAGGIINANTTGPPLLSGGGVAYTLAVGLANVTNAGLMEATNNGILAIYGNTVNNAGGNITANGPGASVLFGSTTIQGGTLNNNGGAFFGTPTGYTATLDGSTSAGAVTLNGAYTSDYGSSTSLNGAIINNGNILVNGGNGYTTSLNAAGNVTLSGAGTVTLSTTSGGGNAEISLSSGVTLDNISNTIQGGGIIQNSGATLINEAGGTIIANSTGALLTSELDIDNGTVTNNGTLQANSGNTLHLVGGSLTNFSGNTLTGGTYNVHGTVASPGTLQIDALGNGGGEIVNNAATILLDGRNSNFLDAAGLDALSNFSNNTATGSFTIQNGRNFTTPGDFSNAGSVTVGKPSTLTIGPSGTNNFNQSGASASLKVNGAMAVGTATINGGMVSGSGNITGNVDNVGGTVTASDPGIPDTLTIYGNYTQGPTGILEAFLGGTTADPDYSRLVVIGGTATLAGTLELDLVPGSGLVIVPSETFELVTATDGISGGFTDVVGLPTLPGGDSWSFSSNDGTLDLILTGSADYYAPAATPEPSALLLLATGMALMTILLKYRNTVRRGVE